jgi:hypothetical protein
MKALRYLFVFTVVLAFAGQNTFAKGEDMKLPLIDKSQLEHFETATFALG